MRTGSTARIGVRCDPAASARVTGDEAVQLANIAREALSNALRHGRPERVDMDLRLEKECVVLEIVDDGEGFNPEAGRGSGLGLASMAARAREAGGALVVVSSRGKGTHVVVRLAMRLDERAESDEREMGAGDA
jgi:signal transduction histidine kinase